MWSGPLSLFFPPPPSLVCVCVCVCVCVRLTLGTAGYWVVYLYLCFIVCILTTLESPEGHWFCFFLLAAAPRTALGTEQAVNQHLMMNERMDLMYQPGSLVLDYCRVMLRWVLSLHSRALEGCCGPSGWSARGLGEAALWYMDHSSHPWSGSSVAPSVTKKSFRNSLIVPGMGLGCV